MNFEGLKYLLVGGGFFGSVLSERIANVFNKNVLVIDKRVAIFTQLIILKPESLDLVYGQPISVPMNEYLLENNMTKEEYSWFINSTIRRSYRHIIKKWSPVL